MDSFFQLDTIETAKLLFFILLPVALFGPVRWAVVAWLAMTNLDLAAGAGFATSGIGLLNAAKSLLFPVILLVRMRAVPSQFWKSLPSCAWLMLIAYAAAASFWSDHPTAAAKMVGNMVGILLTIVVLEKAVRSGKLGDAQIRLFAVVTLATGLLQTFILGGEVFGYEGLSSPRRFTAFVAAQQYAALLVALLAAVLWQKEAPRWQRVSIACALLVGICGNGSRTWFIGALFVVAVFCWFSTRRALGFIALGIGVFALALLVAANSPSLKLEELPSSRSRIVATFSKLAISAEDSSLTEIRNVQFRMAIYSGILDALSASTPAQIVLGQGTSDGGSVVQAVFPRARSSRQLDPNRAVHNEWLRIFYEWGIIGALLWAAVYVGLAGAVAGTLRSGTNAARALASYFPALTLALSTENIFAGAGNAVTIGFSLLVAGVATQAARPWPGFATALEGSPTLRPIPNSVTEVARSQVRGT